MFGWSLSLPVLILCRVRSREPRWALFVQSPGSKLRHANVYGLAIPFYLLSSVQLGDRFAPKGARSFSGVLVAINISPRWGETPSALHKSVAGNFATRTRSSAMATRSSAMATRSFAMAIRNLPMATRNLAHGRSRQVSSPRERYSRRQYRLARQLVWSANLVS